MKQEFKEVGMAPLPFGQKGDKSDESSVSLSSERSAPQERARIVEEPEPAPRPDPFDASGGRPPVPKSRPADTRRERRGGLEEIQRLYNDAIGNTDVRFQFKDQYQPMRLGVKNAIELKANPSHDPEFRVDGNGEFVAVLLREKGQKQYAVFPKFDLTLNHELWLITGLDLLYRVDQDMKPNSNYRDFWVLDAAIMTRISDQEWKVVHQGTLNPGQDS